MHANDRGRRRRKNIPEVGSTTEHGDERGDVMVVVVVVGKGRVLVDHSD